MTQTTHAGSHALLTDLYQLTMAYGYWKSGNAERRAVFHLFYRNNPFRGGYAIAAGLETAVDFLNAFRFEPADVAYLAQVTGNDGQPIFSAEFLSYLENMKLEVDVEAIPEGTVVFPNEPLLRISGPILQCQLLETALLNIINFQSLIATKASRIVRAAEGDEVLEFGLRRAQGVDGSLSASRAAYVGGCVATSNVLAGQRFGIPVRGTHAHSWVMSFETELEAFRVYAEAMPNNCVFLVDTYDTVEGTKKAIEVGRQLRAIGHRLVGIRLDSGDLAALSIAARQLLDEASFTDAKIVASNDLDERLIQSLKQQGAKIGVWGVGTKLVTAYDQPALGGVYKLGAIRMPNGDWRPTVKISEQLIKTSTPGILQVRRYFDAKGNASCDMIYNELQAPTNSTLVDPFDPTNRKSMHASERYEDLLQPIFRQGVLVYSLPALAEIRARTLEQLSHIAGAVLRFDNPQTYFVGLESQLYDLKSRMVLEAKQAGTSEVFGGEV
jgi:nicotinate phosphoribosyltransferase